MESWSSVFAFAVWARKQIVRWGEPIQPIFPMPTSEGSHSINASTKWRPAGVSLWVRDRLVEARACFV